MEIDVATCKARLQRFRQEVGVPMTRIAREVNLATVTLFHWVSQDDFKLSAKAIMRIDEYLKRFNY